MYFGVMAGSLPCLPHPHNSDSAGGSSHVFTGLAPRLFIRRLFGGNIREAAVGTYDAVYSAKPADYLRDVLALMSSRGISAIPLLNDSGEEHAHTRALANRTCDVVTVVAGVA